MGPVAQCSRLVLLVVAMVFSANGVSGAPPNSEPASASSDPSSSTEPQVRRSTTSPSTTTPSEPTSTTRVVPDLLSIELVESVWGEPELVTHRASRR